MYHRLKRVNTSTVYCTGGLASWSHEELVFWSLLTAQSMRVQAVHDAIDRYLELGTYGTKHPSDPTT